MHVFCVETLKRVVLLGTGACSKRNRSVPVQGLVVEGATGQVLLQVLPSLNSCDHLSKQPCLGLT